MDSYKEVSPLWDLSQTSSFSQLPDEDFLTLLHRQFPSHGLHLQDGAAVEGINPQNLSRQPLPSVTPPSEDSSPSPPQINNSSHSRRNSTQFDSNSDHEDHDSALKRKASSEDLDDAPSPKNQHTSANKKAPGRRKSTGTGGPDENRLLKRKEQNRAAQRAFRERKEKHVKDLEDQVAALEAKNQKTLSENENLRDLLTRLQSENVMLKQTAFTFSVPSNSLTVQNQHDVSMDHTTSVPEPNLDLFEPMSNSRSVLPMPSQLSTKPVPSSDDIDWTALSSFDPSILQLLDDSQPQAVRDGSVNMDFGFGQDGSAHPYTTILSNPGFMSFADHFDSTPSNTDLNGFNFDMQSLSGWPTPSPPISNKETGSLDELFGGSSYMASQGPIDFNTLLTSPPSSLSPVSHTGGQSPCTTLVSSPSSTHIETPTDSPAFDKHTDCPRTRAEMAERIASSGPSPFAPKGPKDRIVGCKDSWLPKTEKSDDNIEVLSAWRSITSNPRFKDADINELCSQFSKKARCDGSKVVLEPQGVDQIIETLSKR